jgi:uroporphyrin-III C-methyltransferase
MSQKIISPKVTLVGAGPGDIELITLKGIKAIEQADVILYDALVNEALLEYAPNAKKIFVGKRRGYKAYSQEEINHLIVENALNYGHVVRLKGGDSFVFGRGFEELAYVELFNIPSEIVPGISSSIAVPALANIPVTHRNLSQSFHVISATLSDGSLHPDFESLSQLNGTVVVLMGLSKLREIAQIYEKNGRGNTPFAVISNGTLPNQKTVTGTSENIFDLAVKHKIQSPAVIVIGEVVSLSNQTYQSIHFYQNFLN